MFEWLEFEEKVGTMWHRWASSHSTSYPSFPEKTIHLLAVDVDLNLYAQYLLVACKGQYFIGADNGIFSLIFDEVPEDVYRINATKSKFSILELNF